MKSDRFCTRNSGRCKIIIHEVMLLFDVDVFCCKQICTVILINLFEFEFEFEFATCF